MRQEEYAADYLCWSGREPFHSEGAKALQIDQGKHIT